MTSEEFHALVEQYTYEPGDYNESAPLTFAQLARLERQKGIRVSRIFTKSFSACTAQETSAASLFYHRIPKVDFWRADHELITTYSIRIIPISMTFSRKSGESEASEQEDDGESKGRVED